MKLSNEDILRQIDNALAPKPRSVSTRVEIGRTETIPLSVGRAISIAMANSMGVDLGTMGGFTEEQTEATIRARKRALREHEKLVRRHAKKAPPPMEVVRYYVCGCSHKVEAYHEYSGDHSMLSPCEQCNALYHKRERIMRALASPPHVVEMMLESMGFDNPNGSNIPLAEAWLEANPLGS